MKYDIALASSFYNAGGKYIRLAKKAAKLSGLTVAPLEVDLKESKVSFIISLFRDELGCGIITTKVDGDEPVSEIHPAKLRINSEIGLHLSAIMQHLGGK